MAKKKPKKRKSTCETALAQVRAENARLRKQLAARQLGAPRARTKLKSGKPKGGDTRRGDQSRRPLPAGSFGGLGEGKHCVYSPEGRLVRCFQKMKTAQDVARGFGSGFQAKSRRG